MSEEVIKPKRKYVRKDVILPEAAEKELTDLCEGISLKEAIEKEIVVLKEDFDKMVAEEIAKKKDELRKEIADEQAHKKAQSSLHTIEDFLKNTGLVNIEFGKRLLQLGIPRDYLSCLRDEHFNLDDKALWGWIRANYKPAKK